MMRPPSGWLGRAPSDRESYIPYNYSYQTSPHARYPPFCSTCCCDGFFTGRGDGVLVSCRTFYGRRRDVIRTIYTGSGFGGALTKFLELTSTSTLDFGVRFWFLLLSSRLFFLSDYCFYPNFFVTSCYHPWVYHHISMWLKRVLVVASGVWCVGAAKPVRKRPTPV